MTNSIYQKTKNCATIRPNAVPLRQNPGAKKEVELLLDHLVSANAADYVPEVQVPKELAFKSVDKLTPAETLQAQAKTSDWMQELVASDEEAITKAQEQKAANSFTALATQDPKAKEKLLQMQVPEEIRSTMAMVSAYQWKFVEQAEELRSMAVTKIVEETNHPDARIRLKALEMLGKVTEVALFTERMEVKKTDVTEEELTARIRDKLEKYMGKVDVVDIETNEKTSPSEEES